MYKSVLSIYTFVKNSKKKFCLEKQEDGKYIGMILQGIFETFLDLNVYLTNKNLWSCKHPLGLKCISSCFLGDILKYLFCLISRNTNYYTLNSHSSAKH